MELVVQRQWLTDKSTCGELLLDGAFECYTLEPQKDQSKGKPFAIPAGTYQVKLLKSDHFHMVTPHILNVNGFEAIEIHPGNDPEATHGCTLVGTTLAKDFVGNSRLAFANLMPKLKEPINITYVG